MLIQTHANPYGDFSLVIIISGIVLGVGFSKNGVISCRNRKRAHKMLTIDQKLQLLYQIGIKLYTVLCEKYGIGHFTIADIKIKSLHFDNTSAR